MGRLPSQKDASPSMPQMVLLVFLAVVALSIGTNLWWYDQFHYLLDESFFEDAPMENTVTTSSVLENINGTAETVTANATISMAAPNATASTADPNAIKSWDTVLLTVSNNESQNETRLKEWRKKRVDKEIFDSWFSVGKNGKNILFSKADDAGPILDFLIVGFPKCGTTGLMRTLSPVTTMPSEQDVCTPIDQVVHYSYVNWAQRYGNGAYNYTDEKPLRGSKCPKYIERAYLNDIKRQLPKTKLIVGIRHPVLWFQSFINQQWFWKSLRRDEKAKSVAEFVSTRLLGADQYNHVCRNHHGMVCAARSRFYLSLARLGKTPMDNNEKALLLSELEQTKRRFGDNTTVIEKHIFSKRDMEKNVGVPNEVFLFDSTQGKEEYFYQELAKFVVVDRKMLPESTYRTGNGMNTVTRSKLQKEKDVMDICQPEYDHVRKELLPISYTLGEWLIKYLIPASHQREDLVIPNVTAFESIAQGFKADPCEGRLVRNEADGEYYLATEMPELHQNQK